jgi:hypothetical protein
MSMLPALQFSGKYRYLLRIVCWLVAVPLFGQIKTTQTTGRDSSLVARDSLPTGAQDSSVVDLKKIKLSSDGLEDVVSYGAKDSMWFDVVKKQVHLYGKANVKYTNLNIVAGYILLDYEKSEITAEQFPDSTGQLAGIPEFKDGQQDFTANRLRYNFKSKKGIIYEARTKQEDMYVLGERAKFIGVANADTTKRSNNTIYNRNALLTTCDDPHPHFGIRARKLKVIPDKVVIVGFSNLEIGGVPTPLFIPFGFFPITKNRKAGIIIPHDFESGSHGEGLGVKDFGWYQPISPYMDATLLFSLYSNGSWGVSNSFRYKHNYHYNGNFLLRYNDRVSEDAHATRIDTKSFSLNWTHDQDAKAHPSQKFGGSINIETNRDNNRTLNDYNSVYRNTLSSNINYSKSFPGKPFFLTIGMTHSQNTQTRIMDISLPNASFTMQRVYPFKRKEAVGQEKWYEKISLTYNGALQNKFHTPDSLLFTRKTLQSASMGIQHRVQTDYTVKLLKWINIAPAISYEEDWYPYAIRKQRNPGRDILKYDSTFQNLANGDRVFVGATLNPSRSYYAVDTIRDWGFHPFRTFNASISANTALYLTKQFKHGWFRGIRHTVKPSASIGFGPDFSSSRYDSYYRSYDAPPNTQNIKSIPYNIYDEAIFNKPPSVRTSRDLLVSYSLVNILEFKYYNAKKDTVVRKKIFDNLAFNGNYDITRDTLKWSEISTGGLFRLFKGVTNITWNAVFDPYIANANGVRINKSMWDVNHKLARMTSFNLAFNTGCTVAQLRSLFNGETPKTGATVTKIDAASKDELLSWFDKFNISHRISFQRVLIPTGYGKSRDTIKIGSNSIDLNGDIQLTSKWRINLTHIGYDFQSKQLTYPDLGITRDLHCWELHLSWQPTRGTYFFTINVKPGTLEFLKLPYRKTNYDTQ